MFINVLQNSIDHIILSTEERLNWTNFKGKKHLTKSSFLFRNILFSDKKVANVRVFYLFYCLAFLPFNVFFFLFPYRTLCWVVSFYCFYCCWNYRQYNNDYVTHEKRNTNHPQEIACHLTMLRCVYSWCGVCSLSEFVGAHRSKLKNIRVNFMKLGKPNRKQ